MRNQDLSCCFLRPSKVWKEWLIFKPLQMTHSYIIPSFIALLNLTSFVFQMSYTLVLIFFQGTVLSEEELFSVGIKASVAVEDAGNGIKQVCYIWNIFCITFDLSNKFLMTDFYEIHKEITISYPKNCKACEKIHLVLSKRTRCYLSTNNFLAQALFLAVFKLASLRK